MSYSDHDLVNFGEEYEVNYILKKFDKRQTESNQKVLTDIIGPECKKTLGKTRVTHADLYPYVKKYLSKLD